MDKKFFLGLAVLMLAVVACSAYALSPSQAITGSGNIVSESRALSGFTSVALEGSANVDVTIGTDESIRVSADDNILPLIETNVVGSRLVIGLKPNTVLTGNNNIRVEVTLKSLEGVTLKGSGDITVSGLSGGDLEVSLPGSGNIMISGSADGLNVSLDGSGNIRCQDLQVRSVVATLRGSGNITLNVQESLDARIPGSGSIRYAGNPATVTQNVSGSGTISAYQP